jgi:hypothetical protein
MRLSGLVVAAILLVSATLVAQHSSGTGGSSSGGSSSGGSSHSSSSSGSYSSSGSSHLNSSSSSGRTDRGTAGSSGHGRSSNDSARPGSNVRTHVSESSSSVKPEKKSFFSFLRHRKPTPKSSLKTEARPPIRCKKGENCMACAAGGYRNAAGKCVLQAQVFSCSQGQVWNGFACGARYFMNDCSALAAQLAQQERQTRSALTTQQQSCSHDSASQECADLRGQSGGESLRYRQLQEQYDQCLAHSRSYAFRGTLLPGAAWVPRDDY